MYGSGHQSFTNYAELSDKRAGDSTGRWAIGSESIPVYSQVQGKTVYVQASSAETYLQNDAIVFAKQQSQKLPPTGEPDSVGQLYNPNGDLKQERYYGPDGRAGYDVDYDHAGENHDFPHGHDWDWSKKNPRQPSKHEMVTVVGGVIITILTVLGGVVVIAL